MSLCCHWRCFHVCDLLTVTVIVIMSSSLSSMSLCCHWRCFHGHDLQTVTVIVITSSSLSSMSLCCHWRCFHGYDLLTVTVIVIMSSSLWTVSLCRSWWCFHGCDLLTVTVIVITSSSLSSMSVLVSFNQLMSRADSSWSLFVARCSGYQWKLSQDVFHVVFMAALCNRAAHYIFALWFNFMAALRSKCVMRALYFCPVVSIFFIPP